MSLWFSLDLSKTPWLNLALLKCQWLWLRKCEFSASLPSVGRFLLSHIHLLQWLSPVSYTNGCIFSLMAEEELFPELNSHSPLSCSFTVPRGDVMPRSPQSPEPDYAGSQCIQQWCWNNKETLRQYLLEGVLGCDEALHSCRSLCSLLCLLSLLSAWQSDSLMWCICLTEQTQWWSPLGSSFKSQLLSSLTDDKGGECEWTRYTCPLIAWHL